MDAPDKWILVEDFLLAILCSNQGTPEIIQTTVQVDLSEFKLTEEEVHKLKRIIKKLNFELSDAFSQVCPAASVITEIHQQSQIAPEAVKSFYRQA